jgi:hypothetical protein
MVLLSKQMLINYRIFVNTKSGQTELKIEINSNEIIFRARGCRTETSLSRAKHHPSSISNSIIALISDIYIYELEAVINELLSSIKGA